MIYSKKLQSYIPVQINISKENISGYGQITKYTIRDKAIAIGMVNLKDTITGVKVDFIENLYPQLYSGIGKIADQLEVEHCLKRNLSSFDIISYAALNSHALHYLRGKRFFSKEAEQKIQDIINSTPKGQQFDTRKLGIQKMYMPESLIQKYIEICKKNPLIM